MKIGIDYEHGVFTVQPSNQKEHRALRSLKNELSSAPDPLRYLGRSTNNEGGTTVLRFQRPQHGVLKITPTTEKDRNNIGEIRNGMFFGGIGLLFRGSKGMGLSQLQVKFAIRNCKDCGSDMVRFLDVIWGICDSCRANCEHEWREGTMLGEETVKKPAQLCPRCGTARADDRVFRAGHITLVLQTIRELGVSTSS